MYEIHFPMPGLKKQSRSFRTDVSPAGLADPILGVATGAIVHHSKRAINYLVFESTSADFESGFRVLSGASESWRRRLTGVSAAANSCSPFALSSFATPLKRDTVEGIGGGTAGLTGPPAPSAAGTEGAAAVPSAAPFAAGFGAEGPTTVGAPDGGEAAFVTTIGGTTGAAPACWPFLGGTGGTAEDPRTDSDEAGAEVSTFDVEVGGTPVEAGGGALAVRICPEVREEDCPAAEYGGGAVPASVALGSTGT